MKIFFLFNLPDPEIVNCFIDKRQLAQFAARCGISHPGSFAGNSLEQVLSISQNLSYPILMKPPDKSYLERRSAIWRDNKLLVISDPDMLQKQYLEFHNIGIKDLMLQEQIPGPDSNI